MSFSAFPGAVSYTHLDVYKRQSQNNVCKYVHSNPNNPGIESEPIFDEVNNRYIGYQAKCVDNDADYNQIRESAQKAVKHYKGKLDLIYLFCNKALTTTCDSYKGIEKLLNDAGIALQPITDTTILDLVRKYPFLGKYYFDDHGISHEWFVNKAAITVNILGERFKMCIRDRDIGYGEYDFPVEEMVSICEEWMQEFCDQMPLESQRKKYRKVFEIDEE